MTETGYGYVSTGSIPGWTTDDPATEIDVHNDERDGMVPTDGENWLDLEASPGNIKIGQDVQGIVDGAEYQLNFDVSDSKFLTSEDGPDENLVNVYWGGDLITTIDPSNVDESDFETITLTLTGGAGDGSNRLEFEGTGQEDNLGAAIDNVQLFALDPAVGNSGEGGDDTIIGGEGADTMVGEGGDDTFIISNSADADGDVVIGGNGPDDTTDEDVLDLRGTGQVTIVDADDASDDGGRAGTVTFADGSTLEFSQIETILTDPQNDGIVDGGDDGEVMELGYTDPQGDQITTGDDSIRGNDGDDTIIAAGGDNLIDAGIDDDEITTGDGNDTIVGGEGNDTVTSGGGDDLIFGGLNPADVPFDGTDIPDAPDGGSFGPDPDEDNGRDFIDAGAGNDTVYGQDDDDTIFGGDGDDFLDGGVDDDQISGGDGDDTITGGQGADTLFGEAGSDTFIIENREDAFGDVIDGGTEDGDGDPTTDNENDQLDLRGLGRFEIVQNDGVTPLDLSTPNDADGNSFSGLVNFLDASDNVEGTLAFAEIEDVIPCFTPGTVIATPKGERLVQELQVGDRIITRDNGLQEIRWIGRRDLSGRELMSAPHLKPVLIRAASLGHGLPERDMMVSPQHRVLINNERSALYFDDREVLAAAKHLTGIEGVDPVETRGVSYIHFMFDQHEVVLSNGAWTESFQPGEQVLDGMGSAQRVEIFDLFPELQEAEGIKAYQTARRSLKQHEARLLVN